MKILRHLLVAFILVIVTLGIWIANYLGAFKSVSIDEVERGAMKTIYHNHTGAYYKNSENIADVEAWAKSHGIDCHESFGEYIDDPSAVEEARLRSRGGCIVKDYSPNLANMLPMDFAMGEIPAHKYVMAVFTGSPGIGPVKVYPKIESYMRDHRFVQDGPVLEIYVVQSDKDMVTTYLFPVRTP